MKIANTTYAQMAVSQRLICVYEPKSAFLIATVKVVISIAPANLPRFAAPFVTS